MAPGTGFWRRITRLRYIMSRLAVVVPPGPPVIPCQQRDESGYRNTCKDR